MALSPLLKLPLELWIMILARLDEQDLKILNLAIPVIFQNLINDNELWKQIFKQLYNTIYFTNLSKSNNYYDEFCLKLKYLKEWKHNRGIKTKYTISTHANGHGEVDQVEHLVFAYPKLATYNNGVITILNLENNLHSYPTMPFDRSTECLDLVTPEIYVPLFLCSFVSNVFNDLRP